jgi:hypothetical protein
MSKLPFAEDIKALKSRAEEEVAAKWSEVRTKLEDNRQSPSLQKAVEQRLAREQQKQLKKAAKELEKQQRKEAREQQKQLQKAAKELEKQQRKEAREQQKQQKQAKKQPKRRLSQDEPQPTPGAGRKRKRAREGPGR